MTSLWLTGLAAMAQVSIGGLSPLHVEGRQMKDQHGNTVVLHGVMDTPNAWFNGGRWGWSYDDAGRTKCLNYFEKLFTAVTDREQGTYCTLFRLHLDPAWTNGNDGTWKVDAREKVSDTGSEAYFAKYTGSKLTSYLNTLYFPLAKKALQHGMYVIMRPPGVCPPNIYVDGSYQKYLLDVWDRVSKNDSIRKYSGQIALELANEPINVYMNDESSSPKALHDFFQPIVDKIRANGYTGIILIPGKGYQSNYRDYATYPIEGYNIGYAVHDYTGWYGCSDEKVERDKDIEKSKQDKINEFHNAVPVVDFAPVIITEVDWSPKKPGAGHYNEHGDWVEPNYGTWSTGSTSKWGVCYKALLDHFGNISMTLSGTGCLIDVDQLLTDGSVVPAFEGVEEACGKACMDWYAEYSLVDNPHSNDETGVRSQEKGERSQETGERIYDLQGRRITGPLQKGIYIIDGHLKVKK